MNPQNLEIPAIPKLCSTSSVLMHSVAYTPGMFLASPLRTVSTLRGLVELHSSPSNFPLHPS